jgi:16S rRNA (guanine(1405)-N(7))-methyltransferase
VTAIVPAVPADVDWVAARVAASAKYRDIHPATIADVARAELPRAAGRADLERRTRATLHRVAALYLLTSRRAVIRAMDCGGAGDGGDRAWCREVLGAHASTAERLADLDDFYAAVFELTGPAREVADLACALNPITLPWLREVSDARYVGYDLNRFYVEVGSRFVAPRFADCRLVHDDVLVDPARVTGDVALLLKTYHCMEDRRAGAGLALVDALGARHVVVSFPVRARGGRAATFAARHRAALAHLAGERRWAIRTTRLSSEELLVLTKGDAAGGG